MGAPSRSAPAEAGCTPGGDVHLQEGLGLRDIRGLRIPRGPDVNLPTFAGPTHHPSLEGFHQQVARKIINVYVGSAIAVEAVNRNRTDPVLSHVGEVHRRAGFGF
jgi:hypothetical protein